MYCIGFHSHSASHTRLRPWCGGACLAWRPLICASAVALSLLVQAVVHCGPLRYNADTFLFGGWSINLEWTSNRSKSPPKCCLFSIPPPSQDCSFPLGLGRERFSVGILKGCY